MADINAEHLIQKARSQGITLGAITPKVFPNSGIGIVATRDIEEGQLVMSVPITALRSEYNVCSNLRRSMDGISVHGLLAVDFMLDESPSRLVWKPSLPSRESIRHGLPYGWRSKLQKLLPSAASAVVNRQRGKITHDWMVVSKHYPKLVKSDFEYYWFLVNSRTFYYIDDKTDPGRDPDDCLALISFADFFNHSSSGCRVAFSADGYKFTAQHKIKQGEEVCISYGAHTNDVLLAEYGFILEVNEHDAISLDSVLLSLFDPDHQELLKTNNFWADYMLDADGICYRTEVALRLLCMPQELWLNTLKKGFDEDDEFQEDVTGMIRKALNEYKVLAKKRLDQVAGLDPKFSMEGDVLRRRWKQILLIISQAPASQRT